MPKKFPKCPLEAVYSGSDKQIQSIRSDRVPEELWTEVCGIVQKAVIKIIPKKKKGKKAKWLSEEALQIAEKRREVKGKGEKERYTHLNALCERIARRNKKAFLSERSREIEGKNIGEHRRSPQENWEHQGNISCKDKQINDRMAMTQQKQN